MYIQIISKFGSRGIFIILLKFYLMWSDKIFYILWLRFKTSSS